MQKGKVEILTNDQGTLEILSQPDLTLCPRANDLRLLTGNRITPSYVAFTDEERLVGDAAKNQAAANPYNTIFDIKYVSPPHAQRQANEPTKHKKEKSVE